MDFLGEDAAERVHDGDPLYSERRDIFENNLKCLVCASHGYSQSRRYADREKRKSPPLL
jgi:hypothetical protein